MKLQLENVSIEINKKEKKMDTPFAYEQNKTSKDSNELRVRDQLASLITDHPYISAGTIVGAMAALCTISYRFGECAASIEFLCAIAKSK